MIDGRDFCKKKDPHQDLFPASCLEENKGRRCQKDSGRAAFLISEEAIKRLLGESGGQTQGPKTSKIIEKQEQEWRNKELCIDKLHAEKVGIDNASINVLESSIKKMSGLCGGDLDFENKPLLECYQTNMISPLKCRNLVMQYLDSVAKYREQIFTPRQ